MFAHWRKRHAAQQYQFRSLSRSVSVSLPGCLSSVRPTAATCDSSNKVNFYVDAQGINTFHTHTRTHSHAPKWKMCKPTRRPFGLRVPPTTTTAGLGQSYFWSSAFRPTFFNLPNRRRRRKKWNEGTHNISSYAIHTPLWHWETFWYGLLTRRPYLHWKYVHVHVHHRELNTQPRKKCRQFFLAYAVVALLTKADREQHLSTNRNPANHSVITWCWLQFCFVPLPRRSSSRASLYILLTESVTTYTMRGPSAMDKTH